MLRGWRLLLILVALALWSLVRLVVGRRVVVLRLMLHLVLLLVVSSCCILGWGAGDLLTFWRHETLAEFRDLLVVCNDLAFDGGKQVFL